MWNIAKRVHHQLKTQTSGSDVLLLSLSWFLLLALC